MLCAVSIPAAKSTWPAGVDTRRNDRARPRRSRSWIRSTVGVLAAGAGVAAAAYGAYASVTWYRYGHVPRAEADERDELLDRFMPDYRSGGTSFHPRRCPRGTDACRRTRTGSAAATARSGDLQGAGNGDGRGARRTCTASGIVGGDAVARMGRARGGAGPRGRCGGRHETVETECDVSLASAERICSVLPTRLRQIAWTLRADPIGQNSSIFRTETRALANGPSGRILFRRYWAFASPGIALIRWLSLRPLRREAERRACTEFVDEPHRRDLSIVPVAESVASHFVSGCFGLAEPAQRCL